MKELKGPLLNLTIRHAEKDDQSLLNYSTTEKDSIAFVMFFRGLKTKAFDEKIKEFSKKMTDKAFELGGNYYLPYKAYQTKDQFQKAYPKHKDFCELKKKT